MIADQGYLLVVDDEEMNRDMLSRRLIRSGYRVVVAPDGETALSTIAAEPVDLVLLDVMMPGLSGLDVLGTLRRTYTQAQLPVIMATARAQSSDMVEALSLGANDYITKPIDFPVALARIKTQLERKRAEDKLRESEERYALAMAGANDGIWDWNIRTGEVYYSDRFLELLGYGAADIQRNHEGWLALVHPSDVAALTQAVEAHLGGAIAKVEVEYRVRHADQSWRWVLTRGVAIRDRHGKPQRMAGSLTDITERKLRDPVTGLANAELLNERIEHALEECRREPDEFFALLIISIDRFKMVAGELGQNGTDELLRRLGKRIRRNVRASDTVARMGGEEFGVLMAGALDPGLSVRLARRLQESLCKPLHVDGRELFLSTCIGIAAGGVDYESPATVISDASIALHRAQQGQGSVQLFDKSMHSRAIQRLELEADIRRAIQRQEFLVHYQPIVDLGSGELAGFEALVRWRHPQRGLVSPGEFIPVAEETGLIGDIGHIVLREACRQVASWHKRFPRERPPFLTVNVSGRQLDDDTVIEQVREVLETSGLDAAALKLEITETEVMTEAEAAIERLGRLRQLGVKVAIDDFGTGHSSLSYLHRLPANTLKVDQSFVRHLKDGRENVDVVRTIILLAHGLGLNVVAEGIETAEDLEVLKELTCDLGQGYFFARPLEPSAAVELMINRTRW